ETAGGAEFGEDGVAVVGGGEGFAHVARVGHRFGENEGGLRGAAGGVVEEGEVFGEGFGGFEVGGDDQPDGRRMGARKFVDDGAAGGRANTGEFVARRGG